MLSRFQLNSEKKLRARAERVRSILASGFISFRERALAMIVKSCEALGYFRRRNVVRDLWPALCTNEEKGRTNKMKETISH
jgi:hypothetical protein